VSLFVLGPEAEDRDQVEVGNWAKHKKTFYSQWYMYTILSSTTSEKKIGHELIFFPAVTQKLQFSNFKATVIPISLVILLVLEVFIILVKSATLSKLSDVPTFYKFPGKTFSK
jgi:hypothetical protein